MICAWHGKLETVPVMARDAWPQSLGTRARDAAGWLCVGLADALSQLPVSRGWELFLGVPFPPGAVQGPDAVIRAGRYLLVLEFVAASEPSRAHLDRLMAIARTLRGAHPASSSLSAVPVLLLTESEMRPVLHDGVCVGSPAKLYGLFKMLGLDTTQPAPEPAGWLAGEPVALAGDPALERDKAAWAAELLAGHLPSARFVATLARDQGLDLYVTREAAVAAEYVAVRAGGRGDAARAFPVLNWEADMLWAGDSWQAEPGVLAGYEARLRQAGDGLVVVVPADGRFSPTFDALASAGMTPL